MMAGRRTDIRHLLQIFDSAEQMISAIPEEYRWGKDNACKMGLRSSSRNFVVRVVYLQ
ncbi:MAG: hypothetical protein QW837_09295 [Conexivisphaerales archaeon]